MFRSFSKVHQAISAIAPRVFLGKPVNNVVNRNMHHVCNQQYLSVSPSACTNNAGSLALLQPSLPMYTSVCGLKMKVSLQLRCRHCYYKWKNDRKYVMCRVHPRHKQVERKKKEYNTWIVTHASQSRIRPW